MSVIQHAKSIIKLATSERSPQWPALEKKMLAEHPFCAACGSSMKLQVHHKRPFHLHPELELDPTNLIVLCEQYGVDCHINIGHGDSFAAYNPNVERDAQMVRANPEQRAAVIATAKANRLFV